MDFNTPRIVCVYIKKKKKRKKQTLSWEIIFSPQTKFLRVAKKQEFNQRNFFWNI